MSTKEPNSNHRRLTDSESNLCIYMYVLYLRATFLSIIFGCFAPARNHFFQDESCRELKLSETMIQSFFLTPSVCLLLQQNHACFRHISPSQREMHKHQHLSSSFPELKLQKQIERLNFVEPCHTIHSRKTIKAITERNIHCISG